MYPLVHSIRKTTIQHIQKLQKLYIDSTLRCILEMHSWSLSPTMCHQLLMQLPQLRWLQTESTADITTHDITTMIAKVLGKTWLHGTSGFGSQGHLHHWWQCCHQCRWMVVDQLDEIVSSGYLLIDNKSWCQINKCIYMFPMLKK